MIEFYSTITPQQLQDYAIKTGFGDKYPLDLEQFERFFKQNSRILEVGCGTGRIGKHLINVYDYFGFDVHEPYLAVFRGYIKEQGLKPDKYLKQISFLDFKDKPFDVILFPWTVIGDFSEKEQFLALNKSKSLLNPEGVVILDNPAKETDYNKPKGYQPTKFYYADWKDSFAKLGFLDHKCIKYTTLTGRIRELTILRKEK